MHSKELKQSQQRDIRASLEKQIQEKELLSSDGWSFRDPFKADYTQRHQLSNVLRKKQKASTLTVYEGDPSKTIQEEYLKLQSLILERQRPQQHKHPFNPESMISL
jgi:hypothetical protein